MPVRFYITPYNPVFWREENSQVSEPESDLHIKFTEFIDSLRQVWEKVEVSPPFDWYILVNGTSDVTGSLMAVNEKRQILALEGGQELAKVVVWYRSFVPPRYPLYLFLEGEWESLELTLGISTEEVSKYL